jgi:hypothetical protein
LLGALVESVVAASISAASGDPKLISQKDVTADQAPSTTEDLAWKDPYNGAPYQFLTLWISHCENRKRILAKKTPSDASTWEGLWLLNAVVLLIKR